MRQRLSTIPLFLLLSLVAAGSVRPAEAGTLSGAKEQSVRWTKSCDDDGISVYWSKMAGSPVIAFRGEGIVEAPLEKVASVLLDAARDWEWVDSLLESRVVKSLSPTEYIEYQRVSGPFLMSDRDFVSRVSAEGDPRAPVLTIRFNPAEEEAAAQDGKNVRGEMTCVFRMTPMSLSDETYVEAEIHCDPRGSVPKWVVNFFQQGWPQNTFKRLRRQVLKPDIEVLPAIETLHYHQPAVRLVQKPSTK